MTEKAPITIGLTATQAKNLKEFIEFNLFQNIRDDSDIDGIGWLCDMCGIYKSLEDAEKALKGVEG